MDMDMDMDMDWLELLANDDEPVENRAFLLDELLADEQSPYPAWHPVVHENASTPQLPYWEPEHEDTVSPIPGPHVPSVETGIPLLGVAVELADVLVGLWEFDGELQVPKAGSQPSPQ
jgi:hypothetical protein